METDKPKPVRRFTIVAKWEGDTFDDAKDGLIQALHDAHEASRLVSGGCSSGGHVAVQENVGMTHERYFAELKAYLGKE